MMIFNSPQEMNFNAVSLALGNFDGVHTAHCEVIGQAINRARKMGIKSGVMLFKNPIKPVKIITDLGERIELVRKTGVDFVVLCDFDENIRHYSPEKFIIYLRENLKVSALSAGFDYRFGYMAEGDANELERLGEKYGIRVDICPEKRLNGCKISSSEIRSLIEKGEIKKAQMLLGHPFFISGIVVGGFQNGRKLGFATANLEPDENRLLPPDGVYYTKVIYKEKIYKSVTNIGKNPTFDAKKRTVESHLTGFDKDIYGEKITVEFFEYLRGEKKFNSIEELKEQIRKDKERVQGL